MTTRSFICHIVRTLRRLHYKMSIDGREHLQNGRVHLVLPNHPSYIDPLLLFAEFPNECLCPMVDEKFFRRPFTRWFMHTVGAVMVPDLQVHRDRKSVTQALSLTDIAIDALAAGKSIVVYPSGHVSFGIKEEIGARRLAYETVVRMIDDPSLANVDILMVRTRGLETSFFSHAKKKTHVLRRRIYVQIVPMTTELRAWAAEGDKLAFNRHLEDWYNQDLA